LERLGGPLFKEDARWHISFIKPCLGSFMLKISDGLLQKRATDMLMLHVPQVMSELGRTAFSFSAPDSSKNLLQQIKINTFISSTQFRNIILNLPNSTFNCFN
jgi:hypothetical protein